jgi:hypothetical protein
MLFRFLNLSPPCAAKAARASSIGVLFAVIAGAEIGPGVVIVVDPLGIAEGCWAGARAAIESKTTSVGR